MADKRIPGVPRLQYLETVSEAFNSGPSEASLVAEPQLSNKKSMKDFLKQSTDIQVEIQRLSELCMRISPEGLTGSSYEDTGKSEELEHLEWAGVNKKLDKFKFPSIVLYQDESMKDIPDLSSLHTVILAVLDAYSASKNDLEKANSQVHKLQTKKRTLKKETNKLQKSLRDTKPSDHPMLLQVAGQLAVRSIDEIPRVITTMQTVVSTLPNIEKFIQKVCTLAEFDANSDSLDEVLTSLANWKRNSLVLEKKLTQLIRAIEADDQAAFERATAIAHFCNLFEAENNVKAIVENVYYFVHEMKMFLSVSTKQFVRKRLGIGSDANVKAVLDVLSKLVKQAAGEGFTAL